MTGAAIQLGIEMADARAEEIANAIEDEWPNAGGRAAAIARSFILKPEPLTATEVAMEMDAERQRELHAKVEAAIRADERKKIVWWIRGQPSPKQRPFTYEVTDHAIESASWNVKPKSREQVLEEALRRIHNCGASAWCAEVAQQALRWKRS
jgi:hypothetical protein